MATTDKERKLQRSQAIQRLEFLVSNGFDISILKQFKSLGRISVNETTISDWADRNGKTNSRFPRTYTLTDLNENVTEEMMDLKLRIENNDYFVYLAVREKRNSNKEERRLDKTTYFIIDKPKFSFLYSIQNSDFRNGEAKAVVYDAIAKNVYITNVEYKLKLGQIIIEKEITE